jgi:hypothetical protein
MPRISFFHGIAIWMYPGDHGRPHFHVTYAEFKASIAIGSNEVLAGHLPRRQYALVREWSQLHHDELMANWGRAESREALAQIAPLP